MYGGGKETSTEHYFGLFQMLGLGYKDPSTLQQPYVLQ